jgi:hypothetical protein
MDIRSSTKPAPQKLGAQGSLGVMKNLEPHMKRYPRLLFLIAVLLAASFDARRSAEATDATNSPPTRKIDGVFADWKSYQTAWNETGLDGSKVKTTPAVDEIDLKECYYDNDETYLYLFIKCKPTVQERYDKTHSSGALGYIYIDEDMNPTTGASDRDADGQSTISGAEIQIYLPTGFSIRNGTLSGCHLIYDMKRWNAASRLFDKNIRKANSKDPKPLVAHGGDGVEIALLLSDLGVRKGSKFTLVCWGGMALFRDDANRTTIKIR